MKRKPNQRLDTPGTRKIFNRPLIRRVQPIENPSAGLIRFLRNTEWHPRKPQPQTKDA